jgi:hypothetical protein
MQQAETSRKQCIPSFNIIFLKTYTIEPYYASRYKPFTFKNKQLVSFDNYYTTSIKFEFILHDSPIILPPAMHLCFECEDY